MLLLQLSVVAVVAMLSPWGAASASGQTDGEIAGAPDEQGPTADEQDIRNWRKRFGYCFADYRADSAADLEGGYRYRSAPFTVFSAPERQDDVEEDTRAVEWHFSTLISRRYVLPLIGGGDLASTAIQFEARSRTRRRWGCILYSSLRIAQDNIEGTGSGLPARYGAGVPVPFPPACAGVANMDDLVIGTHCGFSY